MTEKTKRFNKGKLKFELIPWQWTKLMAQVFTMGAEKYGDNNWKNSLNTEDHDKVVRDRMGSALRHINAYQSGEKKDKESGLHHLGHAAWNLLFIFWYDANQSVKVEGSFATTTEEVIEEHKELLSDKRMNDRDASGKAYWETAEYIEPYNTDRHYADLIKTEKELKELEKKIAIERNKGFIPDEG